jgi:hypothetical protein
LLAAIRLALIVFAEAMAVATLSTFTKGCQFGLFGVVLF